MNLQQVLLTCEISQRKSQFLPIIIIILLTSGNNLRMSWRRHKIAQKELPHPPSPKLSSTSRYQFLRAQKGVSYKDKKSLILLMSKGKKMIPKKEKSMHRGSGHWKMTLWCMCIGWRDRGKKSSISARSTTSVD